MTRVFACPLCTTVVTEAGNRLPVHQRPSGTKCPASDVRTAKVFIAAKVGDRRALAALRSSDEGTKAKKAKKKPARRSVRTVSGGLPTLGKRR